MKQPNRDVERPIHPMRQAFYQVVGRVPYGKVVTYGQVAVLAGFPGRARQVGYALAGMPEGMDLPWHRVINAQGKVSPRTHSQFDQFQHVLLEKEGVVFSGGRIDLSRFGWHPEQERGREPDC